MLKKKLLVSIGRLAAVCGLLWLGVAGYPSSAIAQSAGTFSVTGNTITPRAAHTATLLADGRVLIAGGVIGPSQNTPTAELYDPATGTFTATGKMNSARAFNTAALLPDGRVLIVGRSEDALASAELYNPSTGTFTAVGNLDPFGIFGPDSAKLLADGRVLIAGWAGGAQIYDPGKATFTAIDNPTEPLYGVTVLLSDGRVLFLRAGVSTLYDPRTGTFIDTGSTTSSWGAVSLLTNGKVLLTGDSLDPGADSHAEVYDPSTGTSTRTGDMIDARADHTTTLLPDGKVLVAGGEGLNNFCCLASAELYDPLTGLFTKTGSMTGMRSGHRATLLNSGEVLISGGSPSELYHPETRLPAPVLLSLSGDGKGQGAIQHAGTHRIASAEDPAVAGEYLSIYLTGLADGSMIPPQVAIGGKVAEITFFGKVAAYPGLNQVNILVPGGVAPSPAVPVRLNYLGRTSNEVTIGAN